MKLPAIHWPILRRANITRPPGCFCGPACYGDGVAAYPDRYAHTNGSSSILDWPRCNPEKVSTPGVGIPMQALSTNCLYYQCLPAAGLNSRELGQPVDPAWGQKAGRIESAIQRSSGMRKRGLSATWSMNGAAAITRKDWGMPSRCCLASPGPNKPPVCWQIRPSPHTASPASGPSYDRYRLSYASYGRHSGTVWPHVQGFWAEAAARAGEMDVFAAELWNLAELAVRDGMFAEIYHPTSGAIYGGLQEGRRTGSGIPAAARPGQRNSFHAHGLHGTGRHALFNAGY